MRCAQTTQRAGNYVDSIDSMWLKSESLNNIINYIKISPSCAQLDFSLSPNCKNAITKLLPNHYKAFGCHQTIAKVISSTPPIN